MKTILRNGTILTMEGLEPELLLGDIGIDGQDIAFIGQEPDGFNTDSEIDASGCIVMPGLVNAHTHLAMSLMRHYADDLPFWTWLFERIVPIEAKLDDQLVYDGSMLSLAELVRGGVTCFADMYFNMNAVAEATVRSGLRAKLTRGLVFDGPGDLVKLEQSRQLHHDWHGRGSGLISVDIGPHAVYTCAPEYLEKCIRLSEELDTSIHMHLSESRKEVDDCRKLYGKSPVAHVNDIGLFTRHTYAAHCVHLDDDDIGLLKDKGVGVVNNPTSNLKLGNGFSPVARLLESGVKLGLGTDGAASNNNLNMFEEMNLAALVNKGLAEDPTVVSAYTALRMATIGGAQALGLDESIGSLRVGKKADIILIDTSAPHFYPRSSATAALVYAAQASDIKTVICNGELLLKDRMLIKVDEHEVCLKAQESAARLTGNTSFLH